MTRPANSEMGGGEDFKRCPPTVKGETQSFYCDRIENSLAHRKATLTTDVHLNVIGGVGSDEIHEARFVGFMFAAGDWKQFGSAEFAICGMVIGRQRFFEPGGIELGHRASEPRNRFGRIAFGSHAPPG